MVWIEKERLYSDEQRGVISEIINKYNTDAFIASLIAERNDFNLSEVDYFLSDTFKPVSPFGLKGMKEAVELTYQHMNRGNKILAVTDFDNDGLNCAFLFKNTFDALGYKNVKIYIPHRQKESYGLSVQHIEMAKEEDVKLIITGDNGISAFDAINKANEYGIDVIVTDHHEVITDECGKVKIPPATVIVNPHQPDCSYPYKMIAGAGVVYKFSQGLITVAPKQVQQRFLQGGYKEKVICGAAIAAIADVMKITGENRALVKEAFKYLEKGAIPSVYTILNKPSVYGISFVLAPRLSSVARLDDMNKSFEFMCEEDPQKILVLKDEIEAYNTRRKEMQDQGLKIVKDKLSTYTEVPKIIVEIVDGLPETLIGLISGKIKEEYGVPTIIFSKTNKGDFKGSGRSINAYDMFGEISPFLKPENGVTGGGHPMACGLRAVNEESIINFRNFLLEKCSLTDDDLIPRVYIDKYITIRDDLNKLYNSVKLLEPFGVGNPSPVFAIRDVYLDFEYKKYKNGEFAKVVVSDGQDDDFTVNGICWDESIYLKQGKKVFDVVKADMIVDITFNEYSKKNELIIKSIIYK